MNDRTRVSVSPEQVSCNLDADIVILNIRNSTYYELNPVAARVWELLQTETTIAELRRAVEREYDVSPERLENDIPQLLADLLQHELLVVHDEPDSAESGAS